MNLEVKLKFIGNTDPESATGYTLEDYTSFVSPEKILYRNTQSVYELQEMKRILSSKNISLQLLDSQTSITSMDISEKWVRGLEDIDWYKRVMYIEYSLEGIEFSFVTNSKLTQVL